MRKIGCAAFSSEATLWTSYRIAQRFTFGLDAIDTPGDFVECGVAHGAQSAVMALALMGMAGTNLKASDMTTRRVHLFDSFDGVPAPGEHDKEWIAAGHSVGISSASIDQVRANMKGWEIDDDLLVYHVGPFSETMKNHGLKQIAILRLDADLYESTKVCLEALYPLVSVGGWVIVDDFALDGCRKAVMDHLTPGPVYFQRNA